MTVRTSTWRAAAVLVAIQTALVLLAVAGLARAEERVSPTLAILLSAPRHYTDADEPEDERRARLMEVAEAIDGATSRRSERALLLAVGWHESRGNSCSWVGADKRVRTWREMMRRMSR